MGPTKKHQCLLWKDSKPLARRIISNDLENVGQKEILVDSQISIIQNVHQRNPGGGEVTLESSGLEGRSPSFGWVQNHAGGGDGGQGCWSTR